MVRMLTLTLALLIAVTSQHMAQHKTAARGGMVDGSGQVVLCTGTGVVTVTLDRDGNIVEDAQVAHFCPDCALTFADIAHRPVLVAATAIHMQTLLQTPVHQLEIVVVHSTVQARGPPNMA